MGSGAGVDGGSAKADAQHPNLAGGLGRCRATGLQPRRLPRVGIPPRSGESVGTVPWAAGFGPFAEAIVVETFADARAAITLLKEEGIGRALFVPLDAVRSRWSGAAARWPLESWRSTARPRNKRIPPANTPWQWCI